MSKLSVKVKRNQNLCGMHTKRKERNFIPECYQINCVIGSLNRSAIAFVIRFNYHLVSRCPNGSHFFDTSNRERIARKSMSP